MVRQRHARHHAKVRAVRARGLHASKMRRTWTLSFRHRGGADPTRQALLAALPGAQALEGPWEGNPRDYYSRAVTVRGALGPGVALAGRLGREGAMTPGPPDPAVEDYRTPSLELTSDDARALDLAWQALAPALDAAGYADETLTQAPVEAHIIDKGIPTAGLLAQVLVAKFADHLPLYRQEAIFGRSGFAIPRSTLGAWVGSCGVQLQPVVDALKAEILSHRVVHADETPVQMLKPGNGKTHRAYLWAYAAGAFEETRAVVYDFCESRAGENAKVFLGDWRGSLVCDDFSGYKQLMNHGVTEVGCLAHARRKFFDLHAANQSQIAQQALAQFGQIYGVEREIKELPPDERRRIRQERSKPFVDLLHQWLIAHRQKITDGSATARAIDYSLKRWGALTRFVDDGHLPIDNNHIENQIRPIAIGRNNWLFAGSLRAGQRGAAVMSLIQSARLNGHDPYAYLKDVLTRLPTQKNSAISELLPHRWKPLTQPI